MKAIAKACTKIDPQLLLAHVKDYAESQKGRPDTEHIPHPATWFNQERWTDDRKAWDDWRNAEQQRFSSDERF